MSDAPLTDSPARDLQTEALARLVTAIAEDSIFVLCSASDDAEDALASVIKRRREAYAGALANKSGARMSDDVDAWVVDLTKASAHAHALAWLPMSEVVAGNVTLEAGARGLRSLFSSKPSEKEVARVKRIGTLTVRILRCVLASDGPLSAEDERSVSAIVSALGLPEAEAAALAAEAVISADALEVPGEIEPALCGRLVRGAWLAAACDAFDPREEQAVRVIAHKLGVMSDEVERQRAEAIERVEAQRARGLATLDAVRYVLSDRVPGEGVTVAAQVGALMLPQRYRDEALAAVGHGAPVALAGRHRALPTAAKLAALSVAYAAALLGNPTVARLALLRSRLDRFAVDLGEDPARARKPVDQVLAMSLGEVAQGMH